MHLGYTAARDGGIGDERSQAWLRRDVCGGCVCRTEKKSQEHRNPSFPMELR